MYSQCTTCFALPQGEIRPDTAMSQLTIFDGKFSRLKEDRDNIIKAKEALELADPGTELHRHCIAHLCQEALACILIRICVW